MSDKQTEQKTSTRDSLAGSPENSGPSSADRSTLVPPPFNLTSSPPPPVPRIQPKPLLVQAAGDPQEKEADEMAEKVVDGRSPALPDPPDQPVQTVEPGPFQFKPVIQRDEDPAAEQTEIPDVSSPVPDAGAFRLDPELGRKLFPDLNGSMLLSDPGRWQLSGELNLNPVSKIDWFEMRRPFLSRGIPQLGDRYMQDIEQRWMITFNLAREVGFQNKQAIWISNKLTPFAVDAALLGDYPTPWEQMDRQMGVSTTFINLPAINFKKEEGQSHLSQTVEPAMQNRIRQRQGQGQVMDQTLQAFMEDRFAADFSQVRLHTDAQAAQMSKDLGAKAFTTGTDVYFGAGHFQPRTKDGQRLIAHELTHVQQQSGGAIQRKEDPKEASFADQLEAKLKDGRFGTAFLDLNDHLNWSGLADKKKWLADHPKIRYLFLQNQLGNTVAEVYTPEKLAIMDPKEAFAIIDCWYQTEQDKQELYAAYMPIFENLVQAVHPYSGKNIGDFVKDLIQRIQRQTYASDLLNHEFHSIHLLAPTVHRKVLFYHQHEALFEAVSKKFDPFSGLTLQTYERLTDTNSVDREEALQIYNTLKGVGNEQRRAFLDTALFAGALESDKDAEKYYKQKYKAQYKALPHNWDFALPWNSEHWYTPFADRVTVDHAELMSDNLNYEDKATRKFGFDRGIDSSINRDKGQTTRDTDRLMEQIEANFENLERLDLLLPIAVRGGLASKVSALIQQKSNLITPTQKKLFTRHGFMPGTNYTYHADKAEAVNYHKWEWWYFTKETLFGGKSGAAISEQRGTFDLTEMQALGPNKGSLGGMKFSKTAYAGDDYYNTTWLDEQVDNHSGSSTLKPNLEATKGAKRRGNVFASIRDSVKQANIYASSLPFEGINYFADGSLYRSGPGVIQGLSIHLSWTKDTSDPDNSIELELGIENLELNDLQLIAPKSTIAIGKILTQGFRIDLSQRHLPAAEGLFWGLFKNADFMMKSLMELLPTTIQVLPYAILAMTEEFQGGAAHEYKDAFGDLMQNKFYNLRSTFSFTSLQVKDMYDTTAGFLDDFSISEKGTDGKPKRQTIELRETLSWHIDAQFNIKRRQKSIDRKIREEKSDLMNSDHHEKLTDLETAYETLFATYMDEKTAYDEKGNLRTQLLDNMSKQRSLNQDLDARFAKFVQENPFYDPLDIIVLEKEKKRLQADYDYLDQQFHQDQKIAEGNGGRIERFEARKRLAEMEAKYKSFGVDMHLKGIQLQGGNYVRDLINDSLKAFGFEEPELQGIENIHIGEINSAFRTSGQGISAKGKDPGIGIKRLHLPYITAPKWAYKGDQMEVRGGKPEFFDTKVSVIIDFARNPLDKDPLNPYKYRVSSVYMKKAVFNGLQLFVGKTDPLLDFPDGTPVEVFGLHLWDYDPEVGNINLKIQDVKAKGSYHDADEKEKSSTNIEFGLDTTIDNQDPEKGKRAAIDLRYNASEDSISTKLNIASAWLPCLDLQSPELTVYNHDGNAVEIQNLEADIKYIKAKKEGEEQHPARLEIRSLRLKEINAQGINVIMREPVPEEGETTPQKQNIQEVSIPPGDPISLKNLHITGLAVDLQEGGSTLSVLDEDASIHTGETDVSGLKYEERNARGAVLRALSLHRAKFDGLKLDAIERQGRPYRLDEFFKFFGRTRIENLDVLGTYTDRENRGTIGIKGRKNTPISIDYHEGKDGAKDYYSIRLPLKQIRVPALHIEKDGTIIHIPRADSRNTTSTLNDVDVRLRVHLNTDKEKPEYDIWLDKLDIGTLKVFGLEYHDTKKGIDVFFEKNLPLSIPNVKAGGFKFSSAGGLDVFGGKGGWVEAAKGPAAIEANFARIEATLKTGSFLAEKSGGRSALDLDIASLGFHQDKAGNKTINLGAINGALPKMTIRQTDPTTGITTTTELRTKTGGGLHADSMDILLGADKNKVIDVKGMKAGSLDIINTETKGTGAAKKELSKTTLKLGPEALGAESAKVKLNADQSKEIIIRDIKAGRIQTDFEKEGEKVAEVALPNPDQVQVEAVVVKIDPDGNKRILLQKPTLKRFLLKAPGTMPGDYTSIRADLGLAGDMELGDGNFDALNFDDPKNAFVAVAPDDTPISVSNLRLEHKDTSTPAAKEEEADKGYNADQLKLIELEVARDKAWEHYRNTPATVGSPEMMIENPELERAYEAYDNARKAYENFRASIIRGAKAKAEKSSSKRYLDAVEGDAKGYIIIYGRPVFVNLETYNGKKYVRIDDQVISGIKHTLREGIGSTVLSPIWRDENLIAAAKGILEHKKTWAVPSIRGLVEAIAKGAGNGAVSVALDDTIFSKGRLTDDATMFGININVDISWLHDMGSGDEFTVGLCEYKYQHPTKKDYFELYGLIEYLQFVKPALASRSGQIDAERTERLAKGHRFSQGEFEDMDTEEAFAEMIALISFGINQEMSAIVQNIQRSISTVHVEADLTLHPEKVINEWLKERKGGSLNFDKGSKDIKDLHINGDYSNTTRFDPRASAGIGGGSTGAGNIFVPGATYLSADKKTKVSYAGLEIAPVNLAYENDVYKAISKQMDLKGLKIGVKK